MTNSNTDRAGEGENSNKDSSSRNPRLKQEDKSESGASHEAARSGKSSRENLNPKGMGLRGKLILLVLGAQLVSSAFMFVYTMYATASALEEEIHRSGQQLVTILSMIDPDYIREDTSLPDSVSNQLSEAFNPNGELFPLFRKHVASKKSRNALRRELKREINKYINKLHDRSGGQRSFLDPLQGKFAVRFIIIEEWNPKSEKEDWRTMLLVPNEEPHFTEPQQISTDEKHNITISESTLKYGEENQEVRIFTKTINEEDRSARMRIRVFLNAEKIEAAAGRMQMTLFGLAAASILLGGIAGWLFSGNIIRPIETLLEDIQTVSKGNLDHRTKSQSDDEIGVIARTFDRMTRSLKEAQQRELEAKALEHELNIAMEVQGNLLPQWKPSIDGWDIDAYYKPSKEVGGDYYDFIEIDEDHIGIVVADVSGKGIPGSMVMTMTRAMLRMEAGRHVNTIDTLERTNRMLAKDIRRGMFVTCMYVILNKKENWITISSAGHNPLVLWRQQEQEIKTINPNGIALGFDEGPVFERSIEEKTIQMNEGDRFTLFTDGVVESMSPDEKEFGNKRFYELCGRLAERESNQFTNIVVQQVDEHQADAPQHDDITILTARFTAGGNKSG